MNGCRLPSKISQRKHEKGEKCTSQTKVKVNRWFSIKFSRDGETNINIRGSSASYICVGVFKRCNISYVSIVGHSFSPYMFPFVLFLELSIETSTNCRSVFNRSTPSNRHTHTYVWYRPYILLNDIWLLDFNDAISTLRSNSFVVSIHLSLTSLEFPRES